MPTRVLSIQNLEKSLSPKFSLKIPEFELKEPCTLGLFGKNGAGKTTLFQLLTGNIEADRGKILFMGEPMQVDQYLLKRKVAYLPQETKLPKWVTPKELLHYTACLHELTQIDEKIKENLSFWDCEDYQNRPLENCSHGMQKRVGLAMASLYDPPFLILDEPFSGLDLSHTYTLESYIQTRDRKGKTTLLSTHIAPYGASLCRYGFIMVDGEVSRLEKWEESSFEERLSLLKSQFRD